MIKGKLEDADEKASIGNPAMFGLHVFNAPKLGSGGRRYFNNGAKSDCDNGAESDCDNGAESNHDCGAESNHDCGAEPNHD